MAAAGVAANNNDEQVVFKNCAAFTFLHKRIN